MNIISTNHLTKYYGKSRGIIHLDLSVKEGEFFGFIGPNGAGKSTTIRLLLGLIRPTSGSGKLFGLNMEDHSRKILSQIGYIPSEAMFYHKMTVAETLRFSAALRKKDCKAQSLALCERLQLDPRKKTEDLSLGNRRKVSIVCALQHDPKLCIFDEPTSGLDPLVQKEFFDILKERSRQGTTIFLSSHILSEVQQYCDRAAIIREGQMIACGDMANLAKTNAKRITLRGIHKNQLMSIFPINAKNSMRDIHDSPDSVSFLYQGNIKEFADRLPQIDYTDLTITEPDLNEVFLHYYETAADTCRESKNESHGKHKTQQKAKGGNRHDIA